MDRVRKSNREAARLFTEMFSQLGSTTVALFPTEDDATVARKEWAGVFRGEVRGKILLNI
jgi:hypothetical protein